MTQPTTAQPGQHDPAVPRVAGFAYDCPDPRALARFYADLLQLPIDTENADEDWVDVRLGGLELGFQRAEPYVAPSWPDGAPQQAHLDLFVDDVVAGHERAIAMGATALDPVESPSLPEERGFRVYADPAGHPFCLCRPAADAWR